MFFSWIVNRFSQNLDITDQFSSDATILAMTLTFLVVLC